MSGENGTNGWDREKPRETRLNDMDLWFPRLSDKPKIPHYYGDYVRRFFIGAAGATLILAPFLGGFSAFTLPFEIGGALALIGLAAFTSPKKEFVMFLNCVAAGIGVAVNEIIALSAYAGGELFIFTAREALAFVFIFALYFGLKTLRAMQVGQMGKSVLPGEFREEQDLGEYRQERSKENRRTLWN